MTKTPVIAPLRAGIRGPARRELVDDIIDNLAVSWKQYGPNVLDYLAKNDQVAYAKLAVSILPKDVLVSVEQRVPGGLEPQDWALMLRVLDTIKANVPLEANAGPQEVFSVIEEALRQRGRSPTAEGPGRNMGSLNRGLSVPVQCLVAQPRGNATHIISKGA